MQTCVRGACEPGRHPLAIDIVSNIISRKAYRETKDDNTLLKEALQLCEKLTVWFSALCSIMLSLHVFAL